jgi:4-amino-4-deoxy-L-arabinose transferase-like glycosyltransferase
MKLAVVHGPYAHGLAVAAVFLGGFLVRFYASTTIPLMHTEQTFIRIAEALSFNPKSLDLKGPGYNDHPLLQMYLMKASSALFGDAPAAWRFLNVCVGSLGVLAIYGLARMMAGRGAGLAAMALAAVNQFHVAWSRIAVMETVFLTAATLSLILFWYALQTGRRWAVLLNGIVLGVGFLAKEAMVLLPICYFLFLLLNRRYRPWLRRPCVYAALLLAVAAVSHEIYWNLTGQSVSLRFVAHQAMEAGGISLRPVSFFLGELIEPLLGPDLWASANRGEPLYFPGWYEWPMMHWGEGLLLLGSTLTFFRRGRTCWQRLMLTVFVFTALFTMVIYTRFLFNPFYLAALCLIPALIFAGTRLAQACGRPRGQIAVGLILIYLAVHLISFVRIDHSYFKPAPLWRTFWYQSPKVTSRRVILIGIDGTTAETLDRMLRQGRMPHLEGLLAGGVRADVRVGAESLGVADTDPLAAAPVFWTSVVTGCSPGTHRVDSRAHALSSYRSIPALWNLGDYLGLRSVVTNVPGTYPAEPLGGRMIAVLPDSRLPPPPFLKKPRLTYPRSLWAELRLHDPPYPAEEVAGSLAATARTRWQVAADLAAGEDWTLRVHVFTATSGGQATPSGRDAREREEITKLYETIDEQLGSAGGELDDRTWLVLVAARGRRPQQAGRPGSSGPDSYGDGMLLIAGPGTKRGVRIGQVGPLDVAPTILYALGLPVFGHLEGKVLLPAFTDEFCAAHRVETAPPCALDLERELSKLIGPEAASPQG